ncbi:MAG TPA: hypothetical protein VFZ34_07120 [Blastocatellia bacterium]|nr:hypothetical protein [Blastocatellia bacterium]
MKRIVFATLFLLVSSTLAQNQTPPTSLQNLYLVTEVRVQQGMGQEYLELMKNEDLPALKKGGAKQRNAFTKSIFGELGGYIFIQPIESLKQLDEPGGPRIKALGAEGARALNQKRTRLTDSTRNYLVQLRPDLSANVPKPDTPPAKGAFAIRLTIAPGRTAEYESYVKNDVLPILQKAYPKGVLTAKVLLGGDGNEYRVLALVDSFEELEKNMLTAVREGFMKIQSKSAGIVLHAESSVVRYVPELSIQPEAQKAEK